MNLEGKKFSVLGMASSGIAAARKLQKMHAEVFISEYKQADQVPDSEKFTKEFDCEFGGHSERVLESDIIVVSPGVPSDIEILDQARANGIELISEIELGYRIKADDSKIICCTGSNGKSTTVSLIHEMLSQCGFNTVLAGNIGIPLTSCDIEKSGIDFIILELSSFQLELIDKFKAEAAVLLNITPDHLNRYNDIEHYGRTKFNIFKNQDKESLAILNLDDKMIAKLNSLGDQKIEYFSLHKQTDSFLEGHYIKIHNKKYDTKKFSLKGPHNIMNIMASLLAVEPYIKGKKRYIEKVLRSFETLPHRMELVTEFNGVKFINDSKATNTDSVRYALKSYDSPVHIILGGSDKGEDFRVLLPLLKRRDVFIYLIGATRYRMREAFENEVKFEECESLREAVIEAYSRAAKGHIVLLSPACASYDAFKNFVHRGETFKETVMDLIHEA